MKIKATRTTINRNETTGTTEFNDGTRAYWTEGHGNLTLIYSNGTREVYPNTTYEVGSNKYADILMDGNELAADEKMATREEEIEYEMIAGNLSREDAERNVSERDGNNSR